MYRVYVLYNIIYLNIGKQLPVLTYLEETRLERPTSREMIPRLDIGETRNLRKIHSNSYDEVHWYRQQSDTRAVWYQKKF